MKSPSLSLLAFFCAATSAYSDLVAHYALDETGAETSVTDSIGNNHGTLIGASSPTKGIASPNAALGTAYIFPLTSGIDIGTSAGVRPVDQWTMSWWMRPDTLNNFDRIYETLSGTGNDGNGIRIDLNGNGTQVRVLLRDGNGSSNTTAVHSTTLSAGTWYFVAVRYDTSVETEEALQLTVIANPVSPNAAQIAAATQFPNSLGTGPLNVHGNGAYLAADDPSASGANDFGGGLDDFAIFQNGNDSGVLTDAQLASVATIGALAYDPPAPPPSIQSFTATPESIASENSATLAWQVSNTSTLSISPDVGIVSGASGSVSVSPVETKIYTLTAVNAEGSVTSYAQVIVDGQLLAPRISEFVAGNSESLADGDGAFSDWIELENPNLQPLDISGYFLTDDATVLDKWPLPSGTILGAAEFFVIFASGQPVTNYIDAGGKLHTNFSLSASGEYLALVAPDGSTIVQEFAPNYPKQEEDVSYSTAGYHLEPTPGAANSGTVDGFVGDTVFSSDRGFYDATFPVAITCATPMAEIYYTIDGTAPAPDNGTLYSGAISISETTVLRAAAFRTGWEPSDVDTQTYLFTADIIQQNNMPPGYPAQWAGRTADYEMDPDIVNHVDYAGQFDAALKALPTISVVMNPDDMFGTKGIYENPTSQGSAWERPASAELIVADGSELGFQINCGIRVQGGSSRNPDTPKHSLSLRFRKDYGTGKLRYEVYKENSAVEEFDLLQLRPEYNHGWMHRHYFQADVAQYGRDQWASDLYRMMGNPGTHGRWTHLYINGIYWGMYDLQERPDVDFMKSYYGGTDADYDIINSGSVTQGDKSAYNTMFSIANGNITDNAVYQSIFQYLDVDAFIDYMAMNNYVGNRDWDGHNWRAGRKREAGAGYYFFPWDTEFAISPNNAGNTGSPAGIEGALNTDVSGKNSANKPTGLHRRLSLNAEYRMRFADRARKHLFNDGPLSPSGAAAAWTARSTLIDTSIIAESARWGDFRRDVDAGAYTSADFDLYTKNDYYLPVQSYIMGTYFPQRSGIVLNQFRADGLYPNVDAPDFSQHGGVIAPGFALGMTAPDTVLYTLDGTDPRESGGNTHPNAISYQSGVSADIVLSGSAQVKARTLSGGNWSALTEAFFNAGDLRITEIMYRPAGNAAAEFLEITNTGTSTISLDGMIFTQGIDFDFANSAITSLAPGERLLLMRDLAAFQSVHGNAHDTRIAGIFANGTGLSNDGESLTLVDSVAATVLTVTYNDASPWPEGADGGGYSLVFLEGDPDSPLSRRHSTQIGGNPAGSDSIAYTGGDLLDYYLAASPALDPATMQFQMHRKTGADSATHTIETSSDMIYWIDTEAALIGQNTSTPGSETLTYEFPTSQLRHFFRIRVSIP